VTFFKTTIQFIFSFDYVVPANLPCYACFSEICHNAISSR
jgi:hypothetical protein